MLLPSGASPFSGTVQPCPRCPGISDGGVGTSSALLLCLRTPVPSSPLPLSQSATGPATLPQGLLRGLNPGPGGSEAGVHMWSPGDMFSCITSLWQHACSVGSGQCHLLCDVLRGLLLSRHCSSRFQSNFRRASETRKGKGEAPRHPPSSVAQVSSSPMVDRDSCNSSARVGWRGSV